jgi:hypothetical protein
VPEVGWNVPDYLAREKLLGINRVQPLTTSFEVFNERSRNAHQQLDLLGDDPNLIRIRPEDVFCNSFIPSRCVAELKQKPLYSDDDHLNKMGASMLAEQIVKAIKQKGWLNNVSDARVVPQTSQEHLLHCDLTAPYSLLTQNLPNAAWRVPGTGSKRNSLAERSPYGRS